MSNMTTDDLLEELGGYGIVDLRKGLFSKAGSPHLKGLAEVWVLTVTLPGYDAPQPVQSYIKTEGPTIRTVVEEAYLKLEDFVLSNEGMEARERYETKFQFYTERYESASTHERSRLDAIRDPGEIIPPIVWGQRRGGFIR